MQALQRRDLKGRAPDGRPVLSSARSGRCVEAPLVRALKQRTRHRFDCLGDPVGSESPRPSYAPWMARADGCRQAGRAGSRLEQRASGRTASDNSAIEWQKAKASCATSGVAGLTASSSPGVRARDLRLSREAYRGNRYEERNTSNDSW